MVSNKLSMGLIVLLVTSVALSGCGGSSGGGGSSTPTTGTGGTGGNNTGSPSPTGPVKAAPGVAKTCKLTYAANAAPGGDCGFTVSTNWTSLKFKWWANYTAQCYVVAAEPGTGGPVTPKITFTAGGAVKVTLEGAELPSTGSCGTAATGTVTGFPKDESTSNLMVAWTVQTYGIRGQNLELNFLITGE